MVDTGKDQKQQRLAELEQQAKDAIANKQWNEVIKLYTAILEIAPQNPIAFRNIGHAYNQKRLYEPAIAKLAIAKELDSKDPYTYSHLGYAYNGLGEYHKAIIELDQSIALHDRNPSCYHHRGYAYLNTGEKEKAFADFDKAIALKPDYTTAYINRGDIYLDRKDYVKARSDYQQALSIDPEYKGAFMRIGQLRALEEKDEEAQKFEEHIKRIEKKHQQQLDKIASESNLLEDTDNIKLIDEYDNDMKAKEAQEGKAINLFTLVSTVVYLIVFAIWIAQQFWGDTKQSPFWFFPLVITATLFVFPFIWRIRIIRQDKYKYWALREDARSKKILTAMAKYARGEEKDAIMELYSHYNQHHSADMIIGEQKKETSDSRFIDRLRKFIDRRESK